MLVTLQIHFSHWICCRTEFIVELHLRNLKCPLKKEPFQKERFVFQPSIFRGELLVLGRVFQTTREKVDLSFRELKNLTSFLEMLSLFRGTFVRFSGEKINLPDIHRFFQHKSTTPRNCEALRCGSSYHPMINIW